MAKKFQKTIQRVETAKVSEKYKTDNSTTLDDLKIKLAGTDNTDELSHLKNNLLNIDDDPFADLKRALLNNIEEEKEEGITELFEELNNEEITEEEIIEEIIELEVAEAEAEEIVETVIEDEIVVEEVNSVIDSPAEITESIDDEKYMYQYADSFNNNILIREIQKRKSERMIIHIAFNNLNFENYKLLTSEPFEIYHNGIKILDFYQFQKSTSNSYNFKKDIYILRNNLVIDSKTYLLEEIKIVNISL
jgi:hypothetical protein